LRQYYQLKEPPSPTFDLFDEPYLPDGYAWIYPTGERLVNVGVGVKIGDDKVNMSKVLDGFVTQNQAARQILAGAHPVGLPKAASVRMQISDRLADDGLLWVGDAAGLAHPTSGQGIPFALDSGQLAAQVATAALQMGDIRYPALSGYETELRSRIPT
jgi:flavin-dependent dehydrogenase